MAKPKPSPSARNGANRRPMQDVSAAKQASQFPAVGMTLRSYKYDPSAKNKTRRGVVVKQGRWQRFKQKGTFKKFAVIMAIVLLVSFGWLGGKFLYNFHKLFGGSLFGILSSTKLDGEDQGRVNVLLAGNSADDIGHNGGNLTDSIMLMSVDTRNNKAFLLSIPRDLWVDIPSEGHAKINEAFVDGESDKFDEANYPKGGMGLLEKTIEQNFNININYYALVNYSAVRDAVDAVGGVDYNVQSKDPRGLYDPSIDYVTHKPLVRLTNGVHHINGQQALNLSRARGDAYGAYGFPGADFDRTEHQRQLMIDLKSKATSAGVLTNPAKLSSLSDAIGKNVRTDFTVSEVKRLYELTKNIGGGNIQSLSLNDANGKNLLDSYNARGQSALIPALGVDEFGDIQRFLKQQMSNNPVIQEGADVVVLNGTTAQGLASTARNTLRSKSVNVIKVGQGQATPATTIIDASGGKKPATKQLLTQLYGTNVTTTNPYAGVYDADFIVILGNDKVPQPQSSTTSQ
jgi:LCP family protein required for cell wall assembly